MSAVTINNRALVSWARNRGFVWIKEHEYIMLVGNYTHFLHIYEDGSIHAYGNCFTNEAYDTGRLTADEEEIRTIMGVLLDNHK
jgi:hypothetical protein